MDESELQAIERRWEAATAGVWHAGETAACGHPWARGQRFNLYLDEGQDISSPCAHLTEADATFCAEAHQDVPKLLAEVRRLRALTQSLAGAAVGQSEVLTRRAEKEPG